MQKKTKSKIAVVAARGLGDGLLSLIPAHNHQIAGQDVVLFSDPLLQLKSWFPQFSIAPFSAFRADHFDKVFAADHSFIQEEDDKTTIFFEQSFDKSATMVENLTLRCRQLGLKGIKQPPFSPPRELSYRRFPKRIVIHPTSSDKKKDWLPARFHRLKKYLSFQGFDPVLCVSNQEAKQWPTAICFDSIDSFACFVYESGFLIGNDSGPGHLASLLQIPTLSIFARKSYSKLWRPGWCEGVVVTPPVPLPSRHLKDFFWKESLPTQWAIKNFKDLIKKSTSV